MSHYTSFFDLKENPFVLTPDPKYLYLGEKHREVMGHLLFGIQEEKGFMVVVGEVGTGKTTLCRAFINHLIKENIEIGLIYNPAMNDLELLQAINREFKIVSEQETKGKLIDSLNEFLLKVNGEGRKVVLIIDEAQNLYSSVLEQLRLISNLETETGKLIQIILVGQPELQRILSKKEMRQLEQRIVVRGLLGPLKPKETEKYIQHRLKVATVSNAEKPVTFTHGACKKIHRYSGGIPRLINILADRALLVAYAQGKRKIESSVIKKARQDIESSRFRTKPGPFSLRWQTGVIFLCFITALIGGWRYLSPEKENKIIPRKASIVYSKAVATPLKAPLPLKMELKQQESPDEMIDRLFTPLERLTRTENWRMAIKSILSLWNEPLFFRLDEIEAGFFPKNPDLNLWEVYGNLTLLKSMNYPAIVEIRKPKSKSKKFAVLKALKNDKAVLVGEIEEVVTLEVFNRLWLGHAYIIWKNFETLPWVLYPGSTSVAVTWLQHNLKYLKLYYGPISGLYDTQTRAAVMQFQKEHNLNVDGVVGPKTKMMLYSLLDVYLTPRLTHPIAVENAYP